MWRQPLILTFAHLAYLSYSLAICSFLNNNYVKVNWLFNLFQSSYIIFLRSGKKEPFSPVSDGNGDFSILKLIKRTNNPGKIFHRLMFLHLQFNFMRSDLRCICKRGWFFFLRKKDLHSISFQHLTEFQSF